ncbi:MAG: hypothetical protein HC902_02485 [Calothrix sp. SM1_5_4]|nr:hypothetical protein [Calothrix sp. SM1_5_4]
MSIVAEAGIERRSIYVGLVGDTDDALKVKLPAATLPARVNIIPHVGVELKLLVNTRVSSMLAIFSDKALFSRLSQLHRHHRRCHDSHDADAD